MDKRLVMKDLQEIQKAFAKHNVPVFLSYGALLGTIRDKDFIPWDDDVDMVVTAKIDYKTRKAIGWTLYDLGFKTQEIAFNVFGRMEPCEIGYNGDDESGIIVCQKNFKYCIFFFKEINCPKHGRELVCIPKKGGHILISSPAQFYDKGETVKLHGVKFLAPSPVKDFLKAIYGDWKTPVHNKHADQHFETHRPNENLIDISGNNEAVIYDK